MLGIYLSGHPLAKYRELILKQATINTNIMKTVNDLASMSEEDPEYPELKANYGNYKDGQNVKLAGIISDIKKKYTKNNKIMAFITIEDLYGTAEVIAFENCYLASSNELINENIVLVEGRLSIREDDKPSIIANSIKKLANEKKKVLNISIEDLDEEGKEKLRGTLKFFCGDSNNIQVEIINGDKKAPAGGLLIDEKILKEIQEIVGEKNALIKEE